MGLWEDRHDMEGLISVGLTVKSQDLLGARMNTGEPGIHGY